MPALFHLILLALVFLVVGLILVFLIVGFVLLILVLIFVGILLILIHRGFLLQIYLGHVPTIVYPEKRGEFIFQGLTNSYAFSHQKQKAPQMRCFRFFWGGRW